MKNTNKLKTIISNILYVLSGMALVWFAIYQKNIVVPQKPVGCDKPQGYREYFKGVTIPIGKKTSGYQPNYAIFEYQRALRTGAGSLKSASTMNWVQRGPANVGGRTRAVVIDPSDKTGNTWFAGSVSGGIWKTTDGGQSWENLTPHLPNLSTATLSMAPSNSNVLYAGTGEGFGGEGMVSGGGIFVSRDKGQSWQIMPSTTHTDRFRYINKIWVDPSSDSILVVATNKGIFKTTSAGHSWEPVFERGYAIQDIAQNPLNPQVLYAGANTLGVLKSFDSGNNWHIFSDGFGECMRVSLSVSPADTSYVYAGVEAPGYQTQVYLSTNGGRSWNINRNSDGLFINFHQLQGWFNNAIGAHPFDKDKVFIGGVYFGMLEFKRNTYVSAPHVVRVDTVNTASFMSFVRFGGSKFTGALSTGTDEEAEVETDDYVSVEIRFGPGKKQKAHRFTVPEGEGAGVPPDDYTYNNYVDVPFEVWDTDNNRQLMVSFRDQDKNGVFNLVERKYGDEISGREYIFISAKTYNSNTPDLEIASKGGYIQKLLYFLWPTLADDKTWEPETLPLASLKIKFGSITLQDANTTILSDDRLNAHLHVDHHDIQFYVSDTANKTFNIIETNDGGLGFSSDEGKTWQQINRGYLTTQFYGMAKRPGRQEYIGGMQDNGTWQSPLDAEARQTSDYRFCIEGDGFETLWHPWYPHRLLGSSYYNYIKVSNDFGENWQWTVNGIQNGDGPFITKLSHSRDNPNLVFAVGGKGVYKHPNFGFGRYNWELVNLSEGWSVDNTVTSMHHIKVSKADPSVVWAGGGMYDNPMLRIFVSKDYGKTFDTTSVFTGAELGYISGMATHPVNPAEAYILFSYRAKPKILHTLDYGQSWEEISGFGADSSSSNGFPDVMVNDLLVFPDDTNKLWAGTEIGIFESPDNGISWHYANNGLPPVSVWQIDIVDNEIIVATHGRGIWTTSLGTSRTIDNAGPATLTVFPNPAGDYCSIKLATKPGEGININIYKISGELVYSESYTNTSGTDEKTIGLHHFPNGNYIVKITSSSGSYTQKLIVGK